MPYYMPFHTTTVLPIHLFNLQCLLLEILVHVISCYVLLVLTSPSINFKLSMFYSVQRLAAGEWFTARVSSCGLFHIAYPSASDQLKTELRTIYGQLCQDDMPMVRRAAASNLGKFAATVEQNHLKTEIMSIFDDLTQDGTFYIQFQ
jgi:hypothetical protein